MELVNCDIWTEVDFGNGPVQIRCTEIGFHTQHRCLVIIQSVEPENEASEYVRSNIFDHREAS